MERDDHRGATEHGCGPEWRRGALRSRHGWRVRPRMAQQLDGADARARTAHSRPSDVGPRDTTDDPAGPGAGERRHVDAPIVARGAPPAWADGTRGREPLQQTRGWPSGQTGG